MTVDLNADVGEGEGEAPLYRLASSVNVACGGHAGDPATMARAVGLTTVARIRWSRSVMLVTARP